MKSTMTLPYKDTVLETKNVIWTASGTFGYGMEFIPYGVLSELGALVLKGISLQARSGNAMPRVVEVAGGLINAIGLQNYGVEYCIKNTLPELKKHKAVVFTNLYAQSKEDFATLTDIITQEDTVHGVEVNVSCPNVKEGGIAFGQDPKALAKVVEAVAKKSNGKAVCVKLSPNVTDIAYMAKVAEASGADFISCINTVNAMAVNIYTKKSRIANGKGGLSGPCIKHIALHCVHEVCNHVAIPVIASGGVITAEDVLEFILVGASGVQIGTANFMEPTRSFALVKEVEELCIKLGIKDIEEYRGSILLQ
ncbi:MAG: dihydroorotate dehydrogenase [Desulfovibrionaceae bacterium]